MKIIKIFLFLSLALTSVLANFNVHAADQSICRPDANVVLYDNGLVKACQLKNYYDANNIRCKSDSPVSFYDNGNLESCVLYESVTIDQNKCKENGLISFDGKLKACVKPDN